MNKPTIQAEGIYFLTATIVDWVDVFTRIVYKDIVINSLKYCTEEKGMIVYAYCLMTNHLHLIAAAKEGFHLAEIMRDFKKFTSKKLYETISHENESRKDWMLNRFEFAASYKANYKNFQVWQEGNYPVELHSNKFIFQKLDYIHKNPVRAGIVTKAEEYVYSSAIDYAGGKGILLITVIDNVWLRS